MAKFFGTFMQKQAFKNHYVEIDASTHEHVNGCIVPDSSIARQCMFDHFGDKFMTVYDEMQFEGQIDKFGLERLCHITAIDFASSIEYKIKE